LYLIMLEGGEWCYDEASCALRQQNQASLMSSKGWKQTLSLGGLFETDATKTPFAGVNKVWGPYCSSDAWVGNTQANGIVFHGQAILTAILASLVRNHGLGSMPGQRLLFGGCSAGARGAAFTLDYVPALLQAAGANYQPVLTGFLDSPLWLDVQPLATAPLSLQCQAQAAVGYLNATARLGASCAAAYPSPQDQWRCLFGQYRIPLLRTPYGMSQNQFDSFQLEYALGGSMPPIYPNQVAYADAFGEAMEGVLSSLPSSSNGPGSAIFSPACFDHCLTLTAAFWSVQSEGVTLSEAARWWLFGGCPPSDCEGGKTPDQVIEHCSEGYHACKTKCTTKHSTKGGKHKAREKKVFTWHAGMPTPPAPQVPLACDAGPPVPTLPGQQRR
jgi:hypothetical protein